MFCWVYVRPKFGLWLAALLLWLVSQSAFVWIWVENRYISVKIYDQVNIRFFSADSTAKLLILVFPILVLAHNRKQILGIGRTLVASTMFINFCFVVYEFFFEDLFCRNINTCGGVMRNPSMNASLVACCIPIIHRMFRGKISLAFMGWSLLYALLVKSNMGLAMSIMAISMIYWRRIYLVALASIPVFLLAPVFFRHKLMTSGGRLEMWGRIMGKWLFAENGSIHWTNIIPGMGFGTFGIFSHAIQRGGSDLDINGELYWWAWLHNDWLEIAFVAGIIGFVLFLGTYLESIYRYYKSGMKEEAIAALLFGVYMATNYPTHLAISAAFGAWLIGSGLLRDQSEGRPLHC